MTTRYRVMFGALFVLIGLGLIPTFTDWHTTYPRWWTILNGAAIVFVLGVIALFIFKPEKS